MDAEKLEKFFKLYVMIWIAATVLELLNGLLYYGGLGSALVSIIINTLILLVFLYLLKKFIGLLKEG
jgi:hypothetical protein